MRVLLGVQQPPVECKGPRQQPEGLSVDQGYTSTQLGDQPRNAECVLRVFDAVQGY